MDRTDAPRRHRGGDDTGFTLVEVTVAVAIIAVVMLGLGAVFVATAAGTDAQGLRQTAARLATDGLDRAHALTGAGVLKNRDKDGVTTQWAAKPAGVTSLVSALTPSFDATAASGAGATAPLPTQPEPSTVDGTTFTRSFYVAACQLDTSSTCLSKAGTGTVAMYDVVVSVGWRDKGCPNSACTYQLSTLLAANTTEPLFNSNVKAAGPTVRAITNQVLDVTESATGPTVGFDGGNGAVTLVATGLPDGVVLDPTTGRFSSPAGPLTTVTAPTTVTVTATDRFGLFGQATFTWTVNALPTVTAAALPVVTGVALDTKLADVLKLAGGTGPYTWTCTSLPAGLVLDQATGALTGVTAVVGLVTTPCTVTDARAKTSTATLSLTVAAPLVVTSPVNGSTATVYRVLGVTGAATATGCTGTCTWSATGLPAGVTVTAGGAISGKPTVVGTYKPAFTVRDAAGRTATSTVTWTVR